MDGEVMDTGMEEKRHHRRVIYSQLRQNTQLTEVIRQFMEEIWLMLHPRVALI